MQATDVRSHHHAHTAHAMSYSSSYTGSLTIKLNLMQKASCLYGPLCIHACMMYKAIKIIIHEAGGWLGLELCHY